MKSSRVMLLSAFITAVVLVMIGGVTTIVFANKNSKPDQVQVYQQREVEYQKLITQANQQLEKANADLQSMQSQMQTLNQQTTTTSTATSAPAAISVKVSTDEAAKLAQNAADPGQALQKQPDLVRFEGKAAYEAVFEKGSIYIDAESGEVLFNGTVPQEITADQAVKIAADYLKNQNILQVDEIPFRGAQIYRVIFKNGTMAYLTKTGQITYIQAASPRIADQQPSSSGSGGSGGAISSTGREHEHEFEHGDD